MTRAFDALLGRKPHPFSHAVIAEVVGFQAARRALGYRSACRVLRVLAERSKVGGMTRLCRSGRTSIEFLWGPGDNDAALAAMAALRAALEAPVTGDGLHFNPTVVIGLARIEPGEATEQAFDRAAFALDGAPESAFDRPDRIALAKAAAASRKDARTWHMLPDLARAIRDDALTLHYMPKLDLASGRITMAEALSRWHDPRHGEVPPSRFVALAESTGLIGDLTLRTLDRAIADRRRLAEAGFPLQIDVNLSGRLVSDGVFVDRVIERIAAAGGGIGVEITETAAIAHPEAALANLRRIADAAIHIAIDDFGAGLASLSYLRELPANELKIDQSFIRQLTTSNRDPLLVRSAIEIGHALEMEVTAEGVEDEISLNLLSVMRCDFVQGYYIARPMDFETLVSFLKTQAEEDDDTSLPAQTPLNAARG